MVRREHRPAIDEAEYAERRDQNARTAARKTDARAPITAIAVAGGRHEIDAFAQAALVVRHDHDEPVREARDVRAATGTGELHGGMCSVHADGRGVEISVHVDLGAADEARLHLAALQHAHELDHRAAPYRAANIGGVTHRVKQLGRGTVTNEAQLEQADRVRRVRPLRDDERDERKTHPDEHVLAVANLSSGLRDHQLAGGDIHQRPDTGSKSKN